MSKWDSETHARSQDKGVWVMIERQWPCTCGTISFQLRPERQRRRGCFTGMGQLQPQMPFQNCRNKGSHLLDDINKNVTFFLELNQIPRYFSQSPEHTTWWGGGRGGPRPVTGIITHAPLPLLFSAHQIFITRDRSCCAVSSSCYNLLHNRDFSEF